MKAYGFLEMHRNSNVQEAVAGAGIEYRNIDLSKTKVEGAVARKDPISEITSDHRSFQNTVI